MRKAPNFCGTLSEDSLQNHQSKNPFHYSLPGCSFLMPFISIVIHLTFLSLGPLLSRDLGDKDFYLLGKRDKVPVFLSIMIVFAFNIFN